MTLKQYYKSLGVQKLPFRKEIIDATEATRGTFYRWVNGEATPNKLTQDFISKKAGLPVRQLFPTKKTLE